MKKDEIMFEINSLWDIHIINIWKKFLFLNSKTDCIHNLELTGKD